MATSIDPQTAVLCLFIFNLLNECVHVPLRSYSKNIQFQACEKELFKDFFLIINFFSQLWLRSLLGRNGKALILRKRAQDLNTRVNPQEKGRRSLS